MVNNLFSAFDPSTSNLLSLNWTKTFIIMMIIPTKFHLLPSRFITVFFEISGKLHQEFKMLLTSKVVGFTLMLITLFMFILMNNMFGLIPYIFTSSSDLVFSLALALLLWTSIMLFGWINFTEKMLAYLIPMGTPPMLMPFMVMTETTSNLIRSGSSAVRLTANMIAGHLLMSLLGNNTINSSMMVLLVFQMILMLFEAAVALIQSYVFTVLSTLYSSEVVYENT